MTRFTVLETPHSLAPDLQAMPDWITALDCDACLLSEAPFGPWVAASADFSTAKALESSRLHAAGVAALSGLTCETIFGTRALLGPGNRLINEAFACSGGQYTALHHKQVFPDEPGFYEARWFTPGGLLFQLYELPDTGLRVAVVICSELMFPDVARHYAAAGADLLLVPRATGPDTVEQWIAVARMTAFTTGCYVLSSNRRGGGFGGVGFAVAPNGALIARTTPDQPAVTVEINREAVRAARKGYPHNIESHLTFPLATVGIAR